jgi:hypothetical protein
MRYIRSVALLMTVTLVGLSTGSSLADHQSVKTTLPPLKIISPTNGATVASPVVVVFETEADVSKMTMDGAMKAGKMDMSKAGPHLHVDLDKRVTMPTSNLLSKVGMHRYQYSLGNARPGTHTIRLYWADTKHHKPLGAVRAIRVTVK